MDQKWPNQIFPIANFVFSHYGHFGPGGGGGGPRGGALLLWLSTVLIKPALQSAPVPPQCPPLCRPACMTEEALHMTCQRVSPALQHHSAGLVCLHDSLDDRLEDFGVRLVVHTVFEGEVHCVVFARARAGVGDVAGAGEEVAIFVKRDGHNAVGGVEGLLHTVSVVDVNVDVQHLTNSEQ